LKQEQNNSKFLQLRDEYPFFVYQSYSFRIKKRYLSVKFSFNISGKYFFKPKLKILKRDFIDFNSLDEELLNNLVFQIGMVELVSYWKATCSPEVIIEPAFLDEKQLKWWKNLYFNGLGEFFYLNGIESDKDNLLTIKSGTEILPIAESELDSNKIVVPVGGGKDSAVTLELLANKGLDVFPFAVNPREAIERTIDSAGYSIDQSLVIERTIDPQLLELNKQGFLNGHTPFSALIAFTSVLTGLFANAKYIALSNESSANQSTVPGTEINHQYSKSFQFESDFIWYVNKYVHNQVRYFSFLRPLNELQIAKLFSQIPWHFEGFRSCNVASKTDGWCGNCPKCLFTYVILSPFLSQPTLKRIFHKNLFDDESLSSILNELSGVSVVKPFECVGTPEEVNAALFKTKKMISEKKDLPVLLKSLDLSLNKKINEHDFERLLKELNEEHFVPEHLLHYLTSALND